MTAPELRPATAADAAGIAECVRASYSPYVERIGRRPGPMLDDYDQVVRDHRAYVMDGGGEIVGALVLIDKEDGILLDNVAVPIDRWLRGPLRDWAADLLDTRALAEDELFNAGLVRRRWEEHQAGTRNWQDSLWIVLMGQAWRRRWMAASPPGSAALRDRSRAISRYGMRTDIDAPAVRRSD